MRNVANRELYEVMNHLSVVGRIVGRRYMSTCSK